MEQSSENLQLSFSPLSMQTLIIPEEIILGGKSNISSPSSTSEFEGNDNEVDGGLEDEDDPVVKGTTDPGVEISSTFALNEELNCCKGRLDAFGNELKLILAEVTIITGWIQQQFGIQLVNQESLLFKHIYDLDEIEEIATGMSFPENKKINLPAEKLSTTSRSKSTSSRRGRPKTDVTQAEASISSPSKRGRKPKQQLSSQSVLSEDSEADAEDDRANWNPQDFVETLYDKRQEAQSSSRRPRRASTKNINYKETRSAAAEEDYSVGKDVETTTEEVDEDEDYNEQAESTLSSKSKKESATRKPRNRKRKIVDGEGGDPTGVEEEASSEKTEKVKGKAKQDNWESKGPKQCDECGKVVMGTSSLKKHKMMHADERANIEESENETSSPSLTKRHRGQGIYYEKSETFLDYEDALEFIRQTGIWGHDSKKETTEGTKIFYRCKHVNGKRRSEKSCPKRLYILLHPNPNGCGETSATIYMSGDEHIHAVVSGYGLRKDVKERLRKLFEEGVRKPLQLHRLVTDSKSNEKSCTIDQVRHFLKYFKRKTGQGQDQKSADFLTPDFAVVDMEVVKIEAEDTDPYLFITSSSTDAQDVEHGQFGDSKSIALFHYSMT